MLLGELFKVLHPDTEFQVESTGDLKDLQGAFYSDRVNHKTRFNKVRDTDEDLHQCEVEEIFQDEFGTLWIQIRR